MPVRFAPAEPFSADITAAYGASNEAMRNLPLLADVSQRAAQMKFAAAEAERDRRSRAALAGADAGSASAAQSAAAMGRLGAQNVEAQQNEFQRQHQQRLQVQDFQAQAAAQQFEAQARTQSQQLGSWLRRQEFTHADQLELQKQERQLRAVMQSDELSPGEQRRAALMLTSGIDSLRMRQQETQAKLQQQQLQQAQSQAQQQQKIAAMNMKVFDQMELEGTMNDPSLRAAAVDSLGREAQATGAVAGFGAAPSDEAVQKRMQQMMSQRRVTGTKVHPNGMVTKEYEYPPTEEQARFQAQLVRSKMQAEKAKTMVDFAKAAEVLAGPAPPPEVMNEKTGEKGPNPAYAEHRKQVSQIARQLMGGDQGGGQDQSGDAARKFESTNPMEWGAFDANNPPPGKPAELVRSVRQQEQQLQNDDRYYQPQKDAVIRANARRFEILAKPNRTPEDMAEFKRLGEVKVENQPVPESAQQQPGQSAFGRAFGSGSSRSAFGTAFGG